MRSMKKVENGLTKLAKRTSIFKPKNSKKTNSMNNGL